MFFAIGLFRCGRDHVDVLKGVGRGLVREKYKVARLGLTVEGMVVVSGDGGKYEIFDREKCI